MQRIINFILRFRNAFLYGFLVLISLVMTLSSHSYHQSKFFNSSRWVSGSVYGWSADLTAYFGLREENQKLLAENERLLRILFNVHGDSVRPLDTTLLQFEV